MVETAARSKDACVGHEAKQVEQIAFVNQL
jgi:hypothetical protein